MRQNEKTAGIIGGMGPEATVDLMRRIIRHTPAKDDGDHIRCIVDNNPKIPSRINAIIQGDGEDPTPCLVEMARGLEAWGADFLAIPCNTAHYYYDAVARAVKIPVINMIKTLVDNVKRDYPACSSVGILGSTSLSITGLYEIWFTPENIAVIYPDTRVQEELFAVIKKVKAGKMSATITKQYVQSAVHLMGAGADVLIVACTELSVMGIEVPFPVIDASDILAKEILRTAKNLQD